MAFITTLPNMSGAVQKILGDSVAATKNAISGMKTKSWIFILLAIFGIIFLVKKVAK